MIPRWQDAVAHLLILAVASLPDVLAILLLVAAGYTAAKAEPKAPAVRRRRKLVRRPRRGLNPALRVVPNAATA